MTITESAGTGHKVGSTIVLEATDVTMRFGGLTAVDSVSMQVHDGEIVGLIGPNGAGKTTFFNCLTGMYIPTEGTVMLSGQELPPKPLKVVRAGMARTFQNIRLFNNMTALENVELPMLYSGVKAAQRRERALAALARVGLAERAAHTPSELSGGQQQRVAIARALVNRPQLILADEPTGALDTVTSDDIMRLLTELNAQGMTVVIVTHEADIAAWARRKLVFRDGLMVEDIAQSGGARV